jgi:nicotinamidase-related amidase
MSCYTGLLVLDVQVGNLSEPDPAYEAGDLLARISDLIVRARAAQVPIIYVQNSGGKGDPDEPGTPGWQIHPAIAPIEGDVVIQKRTPDSFYETHLERELESKGIGELIIAGIQTDLCVDTACRRAFSLGYDVTLVKDAHSTWDTSVLTAPQIIAHHNHVLSAFAELRAASDIEF